MVPTLLLVGLVSLGTTLVLTPLVRRAALRFGWTDAPDGKRKIHRQPIPNVGGLALMGGLLAGIATAQGLGLSLGIPIPILGAVLALGLIGFYDDLKNLSYRYKFAAQIAVAVVVFASGYRVELFDVLLGANAYTLSISFVLTLIWVVGVINAVNLLDGMDGLAAGVVLIAMVSLGGGVWFHGGESQLMLAVALGMAIVGFLVYNSHPASLFMGDCGSLFLGAMLAAYSLNGTTHSHPLLATIIPVVAMGLPILDVFLALLRRWQERRPLFSADSDHIHHRLARRFELTHGRTVLALYGVAAMYSLSALAMSALKPRFSFLLLAGILGATLLVMHKLRYLVLKPALHLHDHLVERLLDAQLSPARQERLERYRQERAARLAARAEAMNAKRAPWLSPASGDGLDASAVDSVSLECPVTAPNDPEPQLS